MKNTKYYPFERNKYFFGKLLSVGDFEAEQKYVNDKRRIINRFLNGVGVVCGLNVVKIDDAFISIESGLALDFTGREILVDKSVTKKLSVIDGFEDDIQENDSRFVYLCIEYDENEKEPVHSIRNTDYTGKNEIQYNKYREGYRLFLDYDEPDFQPGAVQDLHETVCKIYDNDGICIKHILPKYALKDNEIELKVQIEKTHVLEKIDLNYKIKLECLAGEKDNTIDVSFKEGKIKENAVYEIVYKLRVKSVKNITGKCITDKDSFSLFVGSNEMKIDTDKEIETLIIEGDVKNEIIKNYYKESMESIVNSKIDRKIYLAKISLVKAGSTYIIQDVKNNPFNQYVLNSALSSALNSVQNNEINAIEKQRKISQETSLKKSDGDAENNNDIKEYVESKTGVIKIDFDGNKKLGKVYLSREITHGLGLGNIYVVLGIEEENFDNNIVFGNSDIFNEENKMSLAAKVNSSTGTMVIGVKLTGNTDRDYVKVRWMAYKHVKENNKNFEKIKLTIKPSVSDIKVRESVYFEAVIKGTNDTRCEWSLKEKEGGVIDENGKYTAPNQAGIYEIIAKSIADPEVQSSTIVIVRENN